MENTAIYPVNQMIEDLLEAYIDPETGELLPDITEDLIQEQLEDLKMSFDEKIKALRNSYLASMMDAKCIGAEAAALRELATATQKRANVMKNRAERTKRYIAWLLQGDTFTKDGCKISYRKSEETVIEDGFIEWAKANAPGLLNEPTARKEDIKAALKAGGNISFVHVEQKSNIQIK